MKDIEDSDLISIRYLSEIDEGLVSILNLCPSYAIGTLMVLYFSDALFVCLNPNLMLHWILESTGDPVAVLGLIFHFIYDHKQRRALYSLLFSLLLHGNPAESQFNFFSNPRRSHHHAVDHQTHNSVTERCFSYILNRRPRHFPGIHHCASKSNRRSRLWRWQKPKGVITNIKNFRRRLEKHAIGRNKKLDPFWALILALKYLPCLLDKATRSEKLIALAKAWPYRYPLLPASLFRRDTKKARKAIKHYLSRFDRKRQCESAVAVGPPPLCIWLKLRFSDRNNLLVYLTPPSVLGALIPACTNCKWTCDLCYNEIYTVVDIPQLSRRVVHH